MQRGINHQLWPTLSSIQLEVPYNVTLPLWLLKLHGHVMVSSISFSDQYSIMVVLNEQTLMKIIRLFYLFFFIFHSDTLKLGMLCNLHNNWNCKFSKKYKVLTIYIFLLITFYFPKEKIESHMAFLYTVKDLYTLLAETMPSNGWIIIN